MYVRTSDGSFLDEDGRVIFFSCERFIRDICEGDCCFICGASRSTKPFNDEHVLPEWILRRYELLKRRVTLPNRTTFRYDRYTVPCCVECNSLMGREIEVPVSKLIAQGQDAIHEHLKARGALMFFVWMGLTFLKTHLKDRDLRFHQDLREPEGPISALYTWENLHHIHSVVRCFYTGCTVSSNVFGSFLVLPVRSEATTDDFDFGDLHEAQTMLIRLGNTAFITVFNDSCGALNLVMHRIERIEGPVSVVQLRELMAEFAFANLHLKDRPLYRTAVDCNSGECRIEADHPKEVEMLPIDLGLRGRLMEHALRDMIPAITVPGRTREQFEAALLDGRMSFLFDDEGKFIRKSLIEMSDRDGP
jgi:hypothetical protein